MQSLRDKLIQAGLVSKETDERPSKESKPPKRQTREDSRLESLKQRQLAGRIREMVLSAQVPLEPGDRTFYFPTRKGKLRRLDLSESQAKLLEGGKLAVVERPEPAAIEHSLVPAAVAKRMLRLLPKSVRFFNRPGAPVGCAEDGDVESP